MNDVTLIMGNKNYSPWSLTAWLTAKTAGINFDEVTIPLGSVNTRQEILRYWYNGKVPILKHGEVTVWESISICEYMAEMSPNNSLWPSNSRHRAIARSLSSEVHAGFNSLREQMPMNIRGKFSSELKTPSVQEEINRILAIWRRCRERFGENLEGPFLFGSFSILDAFFAPLVTQFNTYSVDVDDVENEYIDAISSLPWMEIWTKAAHDEPMIIDELER
jgi:glutathione S-transferase